VVKRKTVKQDVLAHQRITDHEKLCLIMQKETNKKIDDLHTDVHRLEKIMLASSGFVITSLVGLIVALIVKIF
jgi:lipopolysaccharide/colanic/teichoic acid biosynthesis glycosyltransferase|tara:strand:+ start:470 stop:688 length:219 start_codon:yes stop_codon:yes gene_type:complete